MDQLVECVPNLSTADDPALLEAMTDAVRGTADVWLLDRTSDVDHGRSVLTMAGRSAATRSAMEACVALAVERIDMRRHGGRHPRLGAVDVVPFVPLGSTSMATCVELARGFAASIAARHGLPVYLYAQAATRPERRILADVRRPRFEGLAASMALPEGAPDFGPGSPHLTAGAAVVGARPFLIAFNIHLAARDLIIGRRIAARLRERDGGLPGVQALGLELPSRGLVQVSLNLLDHVATPLWRVWEEVGRLAAEEGTWVLDSELIGLAPQAAFLDVAEHIGIEPRTPIEERIDAAVGWLRIRDGHRSMALELRLADAVAGRAMS